MTLRQNLTRRSTLARIAGSGVLLAGMGAKSARAYAETKEIPRGMHSTMLFRRRPGETMVDYMRWYEELHAPAFVALAGRCISLYCRNFVLGWRGDIPPNFDALVEFGYPTEAARGEAIKLIASPAAKLRLDARLRLAGTGSEQGPAKIDDTKVTGPASSPTLRGIVIDERLLVGNPRDQNPAPAWKSVLMLKRAENVSTAIFEKNLDRFSAAFAQSFGNDLARAVLGISLGSTNLDPPAADALLTAWPRPGIVLPSAYETPTGVKLMAVVDVQGHESQVGA